MKLLVVILLTCPAFGAITVVDTCTGTTSCTASGTHQPGDLAIYWAYRAASLTAPTNPAGWTTQASFTGSSGNTANRSWRLGCRVLPSTASLASGTITNATNMAMLIVRGTGATSTANCGTDVIPTVGTANQPVQGTTATFSALTLSKSSSLAFLFMGSSTSGNTCMPATGTSKASTGDVNVGVANATGNWAQDTCTITSSVTSEIVLEVTAPITLATCSTNCPTWVQYDQWGSTSNNSTPLPQNSYFNTTQSVLSNNLLAVAVRWFDAGNTITATLTAGGTSMTAGPACHDASGTHIGIWYLPAATGKQQVKVAFSAAAGSLGFMAVELQNVSTSTPVDVSNCTAGTTGPYAQAGSMTTTVANDFIWVVGFDNGDNVVLNTTNRYAAPYDNWNLLGANNALGPASYYTVWGSTGAINPGILAYQTTNDVWAVAAIAFKQSAGTGTVPTGMYVARNIQTIPTATSFINQIPSSGNLVAVVVDTDNVQSSVNDLVDSDANGGGTLNGSASLGAGHYDRFNNGAGFPQAAYAANTTVTNNNTRTLTFTMANTNTNPFHIYDIVGAATSPLDTGITSSDGTVAHSIITLTSTQTTKAVSSTACTNDANSNSTVHFTPSTASGIGIIGEWNAGGPECGMSGTNNMFTSAWFEGENDTVAGNLESSSGNAVVPYSSAAAQAVVFNWANNLFASASGYGDFVMAFKAPAAASCTSPITLVGMGCR